MLRVRVWGFQGGPWAAITGGTWVLRDVGFGSSVSEVSCWKTAASGLRVHYRVLRGWVYLGNFREA